jgi:hypothetical protein
MQESAFPAQMPPMVHDQFVDVDGERFLRIDGVDAMDTFLASLVSSSDVWAFVASNGAVTAGRRNADHAVFPYYTEDRMVDDVANSGPTTLIRVGDGPGPTGPGWEPTRGFTVDGPGRRWIAKSVLGDELVFGEVRPDLDLAFQYSWTTSETYGLVRRCTLTNLGHGTTTVHLLDGFVNIVPAGATRQVQNGLSNLLDAYKFNEITPRGLGIYSLNSGLSDLAEPAESLSASVAWGLGPEPTARASSARCLGRFTREGTIAPQRSSRGVRGAFLAARRVELNAGADLEWITVVDTDLDTAQVADLELALADPERLRADLEADIARTRARLRALVAGADGLQVSGNERATIHHLASVTFNAMRGGVPLQGHLVHRDHFLDFVQAHSRRVAADHGAAIRALPPTLALAELRTFAEGSGDADLVRLALSFLPLTFGRRHGDPSRPWNRFDIAVTDRSGNATMGYEGNWRDIFQNWEALSWSYPDLIEGMVATFVNATTIDGYNPYRISHRGIDWEEPEPDNPWANIGYWNDHQIVYLARLIDVARTFHPGRLESYLDRAVFSVADVPYRIAPFASILADPVDTISFAHELNGRIRERARLEGADGLLRHGDDGRLQLTTLADKLLLLVATKMVNLVPGGGIWMNTQRPEWNDANNALVGRGASVVTTAQVRGFARQLTTLLGSGPTRVRASLADLVREVSAVLPDATGAVADATARRAAVQRLGEAGDRYRSRVYEGAPEAGAELGGEEVREFLDRVLAATESTLRANARPDGLFHSYNILEWDDKTMRVGRLPLMLEGQVAVLASGLLTADETVALLANLRGSALFHGARHSYLLYPDREVAGFLAKNNPPAATLAAIPGVRALLGDRDQAVLCADAAGGLHFAAGIANAKVLAARLRDVRERLGEQFGQADADALVDVFERTFAHREFTGRSQSFFAYEGLGSIYWHMVSKLLLAVAESLARARRDGASADTLRALHAAYRDVRRGLGFAKTAKEFGAFPTDPYSHTPRHAGARQPGMTGQVKEDILSRFAELGLAVADGRITLDPDVVDPTEWTTEPCTFRYLDAGGADRSLAVPAGALAFTFCQVPFVLGSGADGGLTVRHADGGELHVDGFVIPQDESRRILARTGEVEAVLVRLGRAVTQTRA